MNLDTLAIILLSIYAAIAFVDGVLIHLVLLRLHAHEETRGEHLLHSLRAALYALGLPVLFVFETGGVLLWAGAAVATIDFAIGFWDAWIERDARAKMGGLSRFDAANKTNEHYFYWCQLSTHPLLIVIFSFSTLCSTPH